MTTGFEAEIVTGAGAAVPAATATSSIASAAVETNVLLIMFGFTFLPLLLKENGRIHPLGDAAP